MQTVQAAPSPFHRWINPYVRNGRAVGGHWRLRAGCRAEARREALRRRLSSHGGLRDLLQTVGAA